MVGQGVDVVPLEAIAAPTAELGAHRARKAGRGPELQGRAQFGLDVAAEVLDGGDGLPVVEDGLDEGVLAQLPYPLHR